MSEFEFRECPQCGGYGVLDNGKNCTYCGGKGRGGLWSQNGVIGSGEIIIEKATGRHISRDEFARRCILKGEKHGNERE